MCFRKKNTADSVSARLQEEKKETDRIVHQTKKLAKVYIDEIEKDTQRQKDKMEDIGDRLDSLIQSGNVEDIEKNMNDLLSVLDENNSREIKERTLERMKKYSK